MRMRLGMRDMVRGRVRVSEREGEMETSALPSSDALPSAHI
jgi:hypothetical protein